MKTKELTGEQLQAYFDEHVCYEIQHLLNTAAGILLKLPVPNGLQYVVVEAFAIHLRNLIDFLYPYQPQNTDVCAKNFFVEESDWERIRPPISVTLELAKKRANKEVGHLTTARKNGSPEDKIWDVKSLTQEIMPILEIFSKSANKINANIPPELLDVHSAIQRLILKS